MHYHNGFWSINFEYNGHLFICSCTVLNNWLMVCNIFITMKLIRNNTLNGENVLLFSYEKNI